MKHFITIGFLLGFLFSAKFSEAQWVNYCSNTSPDPNYRFVLDGTNHVYEYGVQDAAGMYYVKKWTGSNWIHFGTSFIDSSLNRVANDICVSNNGTVFLYSDTVITWNNGLYYGDVINVYQCSGGAWQKIGHAEPDVTIGLSNIYGSFNSQITSMVVDANGNLFLAGQSISGSAYHIYKWDGISWTDLPMTFFTSISTGNGIAPVMTFDRNGNLYYVGNYANSSNQAYIGKWDGNQWALYGLWSNSLLGSNTYNYYTDGNKLTVDDNGVMYVLSDVDGNVYKYNGTSWVQYGIASSNTYGFNGIESINSTPDGTIYVSYGGANIYPGPYTDLKIIKNNGTGWVQMPYATGSFTYPTSSLIMTNSTGEIFVGIYPNGSGANTNKAVVKFSNCNPTPPIISPTNLTIPCSGQSITLTASGYNNYTWSTGATTQSISVSASGNYWVTGNSNGCSATRNFTITAAGNPVPSAPSVYASYPICAGSNFTLNANTIAGATYHWSGPNYFTSNSQNPAVTNAGSNYNGTYNCFVTVNGCNSSSASVPVTVNPVPTAPVISASSTSLCNGQTLNLYCNSYPSAIYYWTGPNGFTSNLQNPVITNFGTTNGGSYYCQIIVNGCSSPSSQIAIQYNGIITIGSIGSNSPVCVGSTLVLSASLSGPGVCSWIGPNGYTSSGSSAILITNVQLTAAGVYTLTVNNSCGSATQNATVVVNPGFTAPTISSNSPVCPTGTIHLTASTVSGATYHWSGPNGFSSTAQNPNIYNASTANAGVYSCYYTTATCGSATSTVTVSISSPATPTLSSNSPACSGGNLNLFASTISGVTYHWSGPNGFTSTSQNPSITNATTLNSGNYVCYTSFATGCNSSNATIGVTVVAAPAVPTVSNNGPVCLGGQINLFASTVSGASYSWTGPNGFSSTLQNPSITNSTLSNGGAYSCHTVSNGCSSNAVSTTVLVVSTSAISISSNSPVCTGDQINLTAPTISGAVYYWNGSNGFTSNLQNPSFTAAANSFVTYSCFYAVYGCISPTAFTTVSQTPCTYPPVLPTTNITQHTAVIHWSNTSCSSQFQIYVKKSQYTAWQYANISSSATSYTLTGLQNNYLVKWKIRTKCHDGTYTAWSPVQYISTPLKMENQIEDQSSVIDPSNISVYPNPTDGLVHVDMDVFGDEVNAKVLDAVGQMVMQQNFEMENSEGKLLFDFSNLAAGIYFIQLTTNNELHTLKVVVN